ncbi:MAG: DUF5652 family protein [Petrimonas sp.]|nr:DUF5652 family protein [Petrimonas sp.]
MESMFLHEPWIIPVIIVLALFDAVMKAIAMWRSARNNHMVWFVCIAVFNTIGILPIVYLVLDKNNAFRKPERLPE